MDLPAPPPEPVVSPPVPAPPVVAGGELEPHAEIASAQTATIAPRNSLMTMTITLHQHAPPCTRTRTTGLLGSRKPAARCNPSYIVAELGSVAPPLFMITSGSNDTSCAPTQPRKFVRPAMLRLAFGASRNPLKTPSVPTRALVAFV